MGFGAERLGRRDERDEEMRSNRVRGRCDGLGVGASEGAGVGAGSAFGAGSGISCNERLCLFFLSGDIAKSTKKNNKDLSCSSAEKDLDRMPKSVDKLTHTKYTLLVTYTTKSTRRMRYQNRKPLPPISSFYTPQVEVRMETNNAK